MGEKIEHHNQKIGKKKVISLIGDSFYRPTEENGTIFMLRRTDLQRDNGRTLNIVDEIEIEAAQNIAEQEEEETKDLTYEDFLAKFTAHIEGTATNEREAIESGDESPEKKSTIAASKKGTEMGAKSSMNAAEIDSIEPDRAS